MDLSILIDWALFGVSNVLLGASIMMLWSGKLPNGKKVNPLVGTSLMVVGLTMMLVFGTDHLLQDTLKMLTK